MRLILIVVAFEVYYMINVHPEPLRRHLFRATPRKDDVLALDYEGTIARVPALPKFPAPARDFSKTNFKKLLGTISRHLRVMLKFSKQHIEH